MSGRVEVLQALAVTAEVCGRTFSRAAACVIADDLERWPPAAVIDALTRCRREVRGQLTLADIIARIDDGRPSPEEAWAMCPRDEATTVVWCDEMAQAWAVARPLIAGGDEVAGRMAFLETYRRRVAQSRDEGRPVHWIISLGHDARGRAGPVAEAVERGRIQRDQAMALLGVDTMRDAGLPALPGPRDGQLVPMADVLVGIAQAIKGGGA